MEKERYRNLFVEAKKQGLNNVAKCNHVGCNVYGEMFAKSFHCKVGTMMANDLDTLAPDMNRMQEIVKSQSEVITRLNEKIELTMKLK